MSDEIPPPPLRLKPRLRPESEPTQANPAVPVADIPTTDPAVPKMRLKPKLGAAEPGPAPQESAPSSPLAAEPPAAAAESIRLRLRIGATPEPTAPSPPSADPGIATSALAADGAVAPPPSAPPEAGATEAPKFKFKVKAPDSGPVATGPAPAPAPPLPPPAAATAPSPPKRNPPPPFPVVATPGAHGKKFPPPPRVPHVRAPADTGETGAAKRPPKNPGQARSVKKTLLIVGCVAVFVGAGVTYHTLTAPAPFPARPSGKTALPGSATKLATAPGKEIDQAKSAIADRRALEQRRVDALVSGQDPAPQRGIGTPPPATFAPRPAANADSVLAPVTRTSQLAPGVTATTATSVDGGTASPAFRSWVANARINGVFQGSPARALINGRTVRAGQVVDDILGITFEGLGTDSDTIRFRDRTGSTVTRKF